MSIKVKGETLTYENWRELLKPAQLEKDELVDILGQLNAERKVIEKMEKFLKEAVPTLFDEEEFEYATSKFMVTRVCDTRVSLDTTRIKESMDEEWLAGFTRETEYARLTIKELK